MRKGNGGLYPILFLTLVVFISVIALTLTNSVTEERIVDARREAIKEMLQTLFPQMDDFIYDEASERYAIAKNGAPLGQAFMAVAVGYGGPIDILVGLEQDNALRGIEIISQKETPGLGAKITEGAFLDQFAGQAGETLALSKDGGTIDAITGATISSSAVVDAVKEAILSQSETNEGGE